MKITYYCAYRVQHSDQENLAMTSRQLRVLDHPNECKYIGPRDTDVWVLRGPHLHLQEQYQNADSRVLHLLHRICLSLKSSLMHG